ncbi:MAG: aminotransferase class IV [Armatimonadota bacterium]
MIWLNGRLVSEAEGSASPRDRGLLYGDGLFETMLAREGRVFRLGAHLERLARGCAQLSIRLPFAGQELAEAVFATLKSYGPAQASVRVTVTRGVGGRRLDPEEHGEPTVIVQAQAFPGYPPETYERGLRVTLADIRRNEHSPTSRLKTLNYLDNVLARSAARRAGADDALLLNTAGQLACLTAANVFVVLGREVYTPPPSCGVLPGITRQCVLGLLHEQGPKAREEGLGAGADGLRINGETVPWGEVSEAWATNSLMGVAPVVEVAGRRVGTGAPGPLAGRLRRQYQLLAQTEGESA